MKRGSGGLAPPEANGMRRSRIKWKILLFDESDIFSFETSLFFSLLIEPCYLFSRKSRNLYLKKKNPDYQMVRLKKNI